jgi:hypothetical protein
MLTGRGRELGRAQGKKEKERDGLLGWMVGIGEGLVFSFFQILFNTIFKPFLNQIFYIFFIIFFHKLF